MLHAVLYFGFMSSTRHCRQEVPAEVPAATEGLILRCKKIAKGFRFIFSFKQVRYLVPQHFVMKGEDASRCLQNCLVKEMV